MSTNSSPASLVSRHAAVATLLLAVVGAAPAAHATLPADIVLDGGYCDSIRGLTPVGRTGMKGVWVNSDCIGTDALLGGPARLNAHGKGAYVLGSYGNGAPYGEEFTWVINANRSWQVYRSNDGQLVNWGTWSPAPAAPEAAAQRGTRSSVSGAR
ncbi:hypothetical protein [Ideonella sp.]|uniref:hypothetical protein n=1 Tax=Ideonella sp. TaxID=1929293 RepID=UPI0035B44F93